MQKTQMAWVVADETSDEDDDKGEQPPRFQSHNGQQQDQSSDHAVDDAEYGHNAWDVLAFLFHWWLLLIIVF